MTNRLFRALAATTLAALVAGPASAADKEHRQMMADLRIMQEQAQQLQNLIGALNDALKVVNARLDQQTDANRKAFADQKLLIDNLTNDLRVVREKVDDNNVRVGSLSQEVDSLRQLVQQSLARPSTTSIEQPDAGGTTATAAPTGSVPPPGTTPPAVAAGTSPTKAWEQARGDYAAGLYDLAIDGFEAYIRNFPKSDLADDAQVYIGRAYSFDGKHEKAVEAFDKAIRMYPGSNSVPDAYFLKGAELRTLKQPERAREAWEFVVKNFPDSTAALLAKQALGSTKP